MDIIVELQLYPLYRPLTRQKREEEEKKEEEAQGWDIDGCTAPVCSIG